MKYIAILLLVACASTAHAQDTPRVVIIQQPDPFASSSQYPDIPGFCVVPTWEYPAADRDGDGAASISEIKRYCGQVDRGRHQSKWVRSR